MVNKLSQHHSKLLVFYKKFTFLLIGCLLSVNVFSQQDNLVLKAEELVYSDPDEAIKISAHILKTSPLVQDQATANLLMAKSYFVKGDLNEAISYAFDNNNQLDAVDIKTRIEDLILKASLLRHLYIDPQATEYLNKASLLSSELSTDKDLFEYLIFLENTKMLLDRLKVQEAITNINKAEKQFTSVLKSNSDKERAFFLLKARAYKSQSEIDSAFEYINKTIDLLDASNKVNLYEKALIYNESGLLFLQNKEFEKSEKMLFIAMRIAEVLGNDLLLKQINRDLALNYLGSNQRIQHKVYYEEFLLLDNSVEELEEKAVNTFYNIITNQEDIQLQNANRKYTNYLYILLGIGLLIIIIGIFILLKSKNIKNRKREIINYLDVSRNNFKKLKPTIQPTSKRMVIPEETERAILAKLKRFESSNKFLSKDMSLVVLSAQFDTNTKYLSEIISKNYQDNYNAYINKLRINYIIEKLKSDVNYMNYKISYLAEESGYSSHSSFATVFKSIIGMPPATFIDLLRTERDDIKKSNAGNL